MVLVSSESKKHNALKVMIMEPREIIIRKLNVRIVILILNVINENKLRIKILILTILVVVKNRKIVKYLSRNS